MLQSHRMKTSDKPRKKRKVSVFITEQLYEFIRAKLGPRELSPFISQAAERSGKKLATQSLR